MRHTPDFHPCDLCQEEFYRIWRREQLGSALAWALLWFTAGLLASELVSSWLYLGGPQ